MAVLLTVPFAACGGGSSSPTPPTPIPTRNLVGTRALDLGSVQQAEAAGLPFDVNLVVISIGSAANPLEAIADWTFASDDLDVVLYRGECTVQAFYNQACTEIASTTSPTAKPERLVVNNVAAGTYTVGVANFGPGRETGTLQIFATQ